MLSADNLFKQFGTRSDPKEFFEEVDFEKNQQKTKRLEKLPSRQRVDPAIYFLSGRGVEEETRSCFLMLLTTVTKSDKSTKDLVMEKGGDEIARYCV